MSAVERAGWMDSQASEMLRETYAKEAKFMQKQFDQLQQAGMIPETPPEWQEATRTRGATMQLTRMPPQLQALKDDPELLKTTEVSKNLWANCNGGYLLRDPKLMKSTFKMEYEYDPEEVEFLREQGTFDKKYNRRQDENTVYMEAAAKMRNMLGSKGGRKGE